MCQDNRGEPLQQILTYVNDLTSCIATHPLEEEIIVYRGEGYQLLDSANVELEIEGQKINKPLSKILEEISYYPKDKRDKYLYALKAFMGDHEISATQERFMSTAALKSECFPNKLNWEITLPKGSQAMYLDTLNVNKAYAEQVEFLVQRGANIKLESIEFNENTNCWDCKCKVITAKEKPEDLRC